MQHGTVWGCNALYRDFTPHILVAVDRKMQEEILSHNYTGRCYFRQAGTSQYLPNLPNITVFRQKISTPNNSGIAAIYHALKAGHKTIYLIGFDLKNPKESCNIYAGTENYLNHNHKPPKIRRDIPEKISYYTTNNPTIAWYRVYDPHMTWVPVEGQSPVYGEPQQILTKGFNPPFMTNITYQEFNHEFTQRN